MSLALPRTASEDWHTQGLQWLARAVQHAGVPEQEAEERLHEELQRLGSLQEVWPVAIGDLRWRAWRLVHRFRFRRAAAIWWCTWWAQRNFQRTGVAPNARKLFALR